MTSSDPSGEGKFYPGEKRDPLLDQVSKVNKPLPKAEDKSAPDDFASHAKPLVIKPLSPQQILMGVLAVFAVAVTAVAFLLGSRSGSPMHGVSVENRMLIAGGVTILATALLVFSNRQRWHLMLLLALVMGVGLVSLPLYLDGVFSKAVDTTDHAKEDGSRAAIDSAKLTEEQLIELIDTRPLNVERARLEGSDTGKTALGLWMRNLNPSNTLIIKDYIIREMGASLETNEYPRGQSDLLLVVSGIDGDLDALAAAAEPLGSVKAIHTSLHVVEVHISNERFESQSIDKLTDTNRSDFYELNSKELDSIELSRVSAAVRRLSEVKPSLYREDISQRLIELLESSWYEDKGMLCRALIVWSTGDGTAGKVALSQATKLHRAGNDVAPEIIALCLKEGVTDVLPLLYQLWKDNPSRWEPWFREAGEEAEKIILLGYDRASGALLQSACRILGHIGGEASLPALRVTASTTLDNEIRITANSSIQLIEKRLKAANSQ